MSLTPGTRLGPYEILAKLGEGGMGEVYRAKDTRLGRDVAIKTLPAGLTNDAEQRARFEREARAASSLNHPHICVIHDVGSDNGVDYLVVELLEGETVADCLARGPLPVAEAQLTDALGISFSIVASPDGRTIYYGAPQSEANIWKVEQPGAVKK